MIIVIYSGFSTSFSLIWLLGAGFFFLVASGAHYSHLHPRQVPLWMPVSAVTFFGTVLVIFGIVETMVFLGVASPDMPHLDYVIVLGAKVRTDSMSNSLQKRLDKAIEYSQQNPDTVLILSGGKGADEPVCEAKAMYDYLVYNGVPKKQLMMETISTSTVENIAYSKVLIDQTEEKKKESMKEKGRPIAPGPFLIAEDKPIRIGVLTSDFHVFRAKKIAEKWGIPDIYGIASKSDPVLFLHLCVRECAAILKDKLMGNM
ncbi:MAG: YdcF family protein [Hungatella sp.]